MNDDIDANIKLWEEYLAELNEKEMAHRYNQIIQRSLAKWKELKRERDGSGHGEQHAQQGELE